MAEEKKNHAEDKNEAKNNKINIHIDKFDTEKVKKAMDTVLDHAKENKRVVWAGVLCLLMIIFIAIAATGADKPEKKADSGVKTEEEVQKFGVCTDENIIALIGQYYEAYAAGNIDVLKALATPISDNEATYIKALSEYVQEYRINEIYMQQADDGSSAMVSVDMGIKFKNVKLPAPGLDFFYVQKTEEGRYFINNLYSQFNAQLEEYIGDEMVGLQLEKYEQQEEIIELQTRIQAEYETALEESSALSKMVNTTVQDAIAAWRQGIDSLEQYQEAPEFALADIGKTDDPNTPDGESSDEENSGKDENTGDTNTGNDESQSSNNGTENSDKNEETGENQQQNENGEEQEEKRVKTTDVVNLRKKATTESAKLILVPAGVTLKVKGTSQNGKWTKVTYQGKTGFIKNTYLKEVKAGNDDYPEEGDEIVLTSTVNIRKSMSKQAKKVGVAYAGETVVVVMCYEEGWTKVKWNGKTGYILTELLLEN